MDLLVERGGKRWGFEFKAADAPTMTRSMKTALSDLRLEKLWVVYPGRESYPLDRRVETVPLDAVRTLPPALRGT